jgi:hypothetical protein
VIYVGNVHNLGFLDVTSDGAVFVGWGWLGFFFLFVSFVRHLEMGQCPAYNICCILRFAATKERQT